MQENFISIFDEMKSIDGSVIDHTDEITFLYTTITQAWGNIVFIKKNEGISFEKLRNELARMEKYTSKYCVYFREACKNIPTKFFEEQKMPKSITPNLTKKLEPVEIEFTDGFEVHKVNTADEYEDFLNVFGASFEIDEESLDVFRQWQVNRDGFGEDAVFKNFIGTYQGLAVASGSHYTKDGYCGFYNVGVLEEARRKGLGQQITHFILNDGIKRGAIEGGCYSSPMGMNVYKQAGLEPGPNLVCYMKP